MKKEQFEQWVMAYLRGEMDTKEKTTFDSFLKQNPHYGKEFSDLEATWAKLDEIPTPEPSKKMDQGFFELLHAQQLENEKSHNWFHNLISSISPWFRPQLAYGLLILVLGLTAGYFLNLGDKNSLSDTKMVSNQETEEVREKLVLTLLEQPSANKRLQGVSEANKIEKVDEKVISALLKTLNNDSNVNVRLAAIESLTNYVDNPIVRQGLVQSIPNQESPIVQVTLANLMTTLQEKKSIEPFKKLLEEKKLDTAVTRKIKSTIESII